MISRLPPGRLPPGRLHRAGAWRGAIGPAA